jgi:Fur family transcriptional regulator, ferric uptake regulator
MKDTNALLKEFHLRTTSGRIEVLELFLKKSYALSHSDIERDMPANFDRVTLYRTLRTFLEKGLVHKVLDDEGGLKYALCDHQCSTTTHHHNHVHFKCSGCGQTTCLNLAIPDIKLPKGFLIKDANLLIQGICPKCL